MGGKATCRAQREPLMATTRPILRFKLPPVCPPDGALVQRHLPLVHAHDTHAADARDRAPLEAPLAPRHEHVAPLRLADGQREVRVGEIAAAAWSEEHGALVGEVDATPFITTYVPDMFCDAVLPMYRDAGKPSKPAKVITWLSPIEPTSRPASSTEVRANQYEG